MLRSFIASALVLASTAAFAKKAPIAHYELNFKQGKVVTESHLGMCDDSYYGGFTVSLPGRQNVDFTLKKIELESGCSLKSVKQQTKPGTLNEIRTIFFIEGSCGGEMNFETIRGRMKATMEINDAC